MTGSDLQPETRCPTIEDLRACAHGQLPEGWALLLLQHVEQCPACRQEFDRHLCHDDNMREVSQKLKPNE